MERAQNLRGDGAQQHQVVGVVGVGITPPDLRSFLDRLGDVDSGVLYCEVHQRGGAADQRGAAHLFRRGGLEVAVTHDRCGDVGVRLDAPWHYHHSLGVDHTACLIGQSAGSSDRNNLFALNRNVPFTNSHGSYNLSASYNQVQHYRTLRSSVISGMPSLDNGV